MNSMFSLNKHDLLSFDHLLPSDVISQSTEPTVAQLIDKRIQKLTRQCFDVQSYNEQIEQWFMEKEKAKEDKTDEIVEEIQDKKEDEKQQEEKTQTTQEEKEKEKESKQQTVTKIDTIENDTNKNEDEDATKTVTEKKPIVSKYPDLENIEDPFTKYALIMFHAMISSLDLAQHIDILCADNVTDSEHYGVISKYIENLHAIFSSMTTHEIRSGLKGKNESSDKSIDFGVLSHIKQFVIECISSKTKTKTKTNNKLIWQQLFEILIKLSIGNTNVSSLLQCIWYLLTLIEDQCDEDNNENNIKFNLKSTMKYIANLRMLNIAENNKKYINSTVYGFGKSSEGRIGCKLHLNEQLISEPRNIDALNGANICKLAAFSSHCLALTNNGSVYSWGSSKNLGYGNNTSSLPRLIEMKQVIIDISCGMAHSLLITANGYVYSFGHGTNGRLGHNDETHRNTPTLIKSLVQQNKLIISGHCGSTFNLLIDDNGNLYSFGKNNVGQCGLNNTSDPILTPTAITMPNANTYKSIVIHAAAGWDHALCCCSDGRIYSWGNGYEGARGVLGHGDKAMRCKPTQIEKLKEEHVIHVCCGYDHSLCCTQNGDVYSWGWGQYGQLGCGSRKEQLSPVKLKISNASKSNKIIQIAAGENHTLCLDEKGVCYSFGHCQEYQTGHGLKQSSSSVIIEPQAINAKYFKNIPIRYVTAGDKFSLILTAKMDKNEASDDENSSVQNESGLNELKSSFVVVKLLKSNASLESNDSLEAIQVITHIISVIDRSCKYIVPSTEQFWSGNDKKHSKNVEPFTFELSIDTFVLLNDILQCTVEKIQAHLTEDRSLPKQQEWDGWLWWILASILRILKAHFHVLSNRIVDDLDIFKTESDTALLAKIHSTILNLLHGRTFKYVPDTHDNKTRLRILDIRRESGEVLICGLHVFHKNPNDRLTLLKSILIEENELIEDDQILPFGRSLKEGLLQVFAQQIASQQIQSFTNNELFDDWLIVLDSVMQTIHKHMNKKVIYIKKEKETESESATQNTSMDLVKYNVAYCKCGEQLKQLDYKKCYSGAGVNCDFCAVSIIKNVWHCVKAKDSAVHPNGFDLCGHCTKLPMIEQKYVDAEADDDKSEKKHDYNDNEKEVIETVSFEGEDINERCPPRHPLIAAFQSTLSSSLSSKKTEHLKAMESYTTILFKHSEKVISDLYDKYIEIKNEISNNDALSDENKKSECKLVRFEIDRLIEVSLMGEGGLWYWLHILHVLAIYPFYTETTFNSALNIIQLLYKMRDKPDIKDTKRVLPFEKICNLLTSLCVRLTLYQWKHHDIYKLQEKEEEKKTEEKTDDDKNKLIKLRVGGNRIKALQKLLTLLECEHSAQSYIILLNTSRTTISLATLFHEVHYLEGLDLDNVSNEHKEELSQLFAKVIGRITMLCVDKGLLLSPIGPQLTNVLIPVLIDSEYELLHKYNIIELISDHIKYVLQYKMSKDSSFKQQFQYKRDNLDSDGKEDEKESKLQYNIPLDDKENVVLDKIQRGLIHALTYLVNQLHRDNGSKLRFIRKQNKERKKEKDKDNGHKPKKKTLCKAEELVLTKLMDLFYERIHICCDVLSSRRAIKPSVCTLMERTHAVNTSKKQRKSRFKSNQFLNTNIEQLRREPIYILRKEMSLGDKSPNRSYVDTTQRNLLIQGRYQLLSKANKLEVNKCKDTNKNNNIVKKAESSSITLCNAFDPPSDAYNFSLSFWIKPRDTKIMRCAWGKQLIYRGKKGQMHPSILFVGSHPSVSVSFTVKENNKTNIVELLCPLPAKANECYNKWWHIVVTLKDNQISVVVNGDYVRETTFTGTISPPVTQFYNVGKLATKPSKTQIEADAAQKMICQHIFDGHIRSLAHYFVPLTKSQIMDIYQRQFEIENNALDCFHLFGYKSLHLLTTLMSNHALVAPFFCVMDGYHNDDENELVPDDDDINGAEEKKETDESVKNEERKAISTYDSAKWFHLFFKVFKYGGFKLRREVIAIFRMVFKNKSSKINLKHLSFALNVKTPHHVLDEIMTSVICSVWTKEYALDTMMQSEVSSVPLKQLMENDKDTEYGLNDKDAKTIYSSYITTYKASNLIEEDIDSNVSTMFGCHLLQLLWDMAANKDIIDSYITKQLKLRLHDHKKEKSKAPKKTYAQSIASKPPPTADNNAKAIKSSNDKTETVKFIAVLYLLNGSMLRLLPHQMAFDSNRSVNLPQLTLNRGYICRLMISTNNVVFRSEITGPQHLSLDNLIPIPYLSSCFVSDSSDDCFNTIIKGTSTAISKLFTRFYNTESSTSNQQLIVSRVTIMMINALCRSLDPMFNSLTSTKKVFARIATNAHFNTLCNKILSLSKNIIPSEIKLDANDVFPTQIKWDTPMLDLGYLEKYVQILQSYLWTNKCKETTMKSTTTKRKSKSKKKSSKKLDKDNKHKNGKTYNWPSGPSNCTEAKSVQYVFKEYRGKKKALICELCRGKPLGAVTAYHDIWKHFMIRHYDLLEKHVNLNKEFKTLRDKLDGGGDGADGDGVSVDPRFKNLNQEYVQNLAMMGFPIEWCQFALAECNNDIAAASDWLLNHLDNIDEIMRQREEQRIQEKRKKINDKKRKAAQFMMEYQMQYDTIKDYGNRFRNNDYLDIFTPINIVKKSNNNNVYDTISNNKSYSMNGSGTKYTARASFRRFELAHLLLRITEKYTSSQISTLLARAQFYLATMYSRKLIALLLYHSHHMNKTQTQHDEDDITEDAVDDAPSSTSSVSTPPVCESTMDEVEDEKEEKEQKEEKEEMDQDSNEEQKVDKENKVDDEPVVNENDEDIAPDSPMPKIELAKEEDVRVDVENKDETEDTADEQGAFVEKDIKKESKKKSKKRENCSKKKDKNIKMDIDKFGSIPLIAFMDHMSKKNPAHLMHVVLNMIHLLTFRGDLFHDFKRSKHKMDDPLHYNIVNENVRLFIRQNLLSGNASDNITHKRLSRHFAQNLTKFCVDHLKLLLVNSKQLDNIKWGEREISFRDEQVLSHSLLLDHVKTHFSKSRTKSNARKKSKKSKKDKKASKENEKQKEKSNKKEPKPDAEYVCLERVTMIFNELFATNSVEIYTPSVYNILWDSFMLSPNIYVKAMAFKFLSHLEAHWNQFASDPLKESKPKRMTLKIFHRLKAMFDKLYILEKRSENDHFSVLLTSLSEFLSRVNWQNQMEESKEEKDDDDDNNIVDNVVYEKHRQWTTYKLNNGVSSGAAYWTLQINSSRQPTMICVGIVNKEFDGTKCIGSSDNSVGLLGDGSLWRFGHMISSQFTSNKQFEAGTKIGIYLNLNRGELMFTMNGSEASENDIKQKIDSECAKMILPQSISSMVCGVPQSTPTLVSSNNNNSTSLYSNLLKNRIIKLNINKDSVWYPAVSLYSQKDAIRLIKEQCYVSSLALDDEKLPPILPSPIPKCDQFINIIRTVVALNKNNLELIPKEVMTNASDWLLSWVQNEKRFCRFGAFGYDVAIESAQLSKHNVEVGDLVSFSSKVCRVMGEFRGRIILKNEANPNQEHLYFVEWKEFDKKIKINQSTKSNKFKRRYDLEMKTDSSFTAAFDAFEETVNDLENGIFEATIQSLSKADLVEINKEITNIWKTKGKTAFDLTINDFIEHKIAKNNIICGFGLIRYINKYIHWLFPLFNPSLFYSYFNELLVQFGDLMFCHLRMSLILHLLTDDVEHGNSSRVKSIHLNLLNEKHSIFEQLSAKINSNAPMDTIYRSVIPDRYGQLRIFMPSFAFCGNNKVNDGDEGGQYRQLFSMIMKELFAFDESISKSQNTSENTSNIFGNLWIQKKQKKHHTLFKKELDAFKLLETLGRIIGLSVRSLLHINIDGIPDWFWDSLWNNSDAVDDDNVSINSECIMSIRKGLFFVLPKQLRYLLDVNQFKLLLRGECPQYDLSAFSIKQLMMKQNETTSPLQETFVINKTLIQNRMVLLLERSAAYMEPLTRSTSHIDMFWRVLFRLSKMELFKFIQFISGHNVWPLYITSHSNVSQTNIYSNYVQSNANHNKKLPISSMNLSADVLYDVEYINFLIKSYYLYGSIMHNKSNQIHNDQINYLWIIDQCHITFCNQTPKMKAAPDKYLPEVHTCTCSIRLPSYSSETILKTKLLKAIELCDTFDALHTAFPISKIVQKRSRTFKANITQRLQDLFK